MRKLFVTAAFVAGCHGSVSGSPPSVATDAGDPRSTVDASEPVSTDAGATTVPADTGATTVPAGLLELSNLRYVGAFRLPDTNLGPSTFAYADAKIAFNPTNNSLFVGGHNQDDMIAEIRIPEASSIVDDFDALPRATIVQPFADPSDGRLAVLDEEGYGIGGLLVYEDRLYGTGWSYYDNLPFSVLSHFSRSLDLDAVGSVDGLYEVGTLGGGFVGGWLTPVPREWQDEIGAPVLTGMCCTPIVSRTSYGPALFAWDPATLGEEPTDLSPLVYYPQDEAPGGWGSDSDFFNGTGGVGGVLFPEGSSSVWFFGTHGGGDFCYGIGVDDPALHETRNEDGSMLCYDPVDEYHGTHGYPYIYRIWAYDVNELARSVRGEVEPWDIEPYAMWPLELAYGVENTAIGGVAYDPTTQRVWITQGYANQNEPVVYEYRIEL